MNKPQRAGNFNRR